MMIKICAFARFAHLRVSIFVYTYYVLPVYIDTLCNYYIISSNNCIVID